MKRIEISEEDLIKWLNDGLSKYEECVNCRINSVYQLVENDENGNNWEENYIQASGRHLGLCTPIAIQLIREAKQKFNVKWE